MYKLLHMLFGWDYIAWSNSADSGIARVYLNPDGVAWYWRYKGTMLIDEIHTADQVIWLTCKSNNYIND